MSIGYVLLWIVALSNLSLIVRAVRLHARRNLGWILASALVLVLMASAAWQDVETAGWIGAGLWVFLVLIPGRGGRAIEQLCARQDFKKAYRRSLFLRWLHPADGYFQVPVLLRSLLDFQEGKHFSTTELLRRTGPIHNPLPRNVLAHWFSATGDWEGFVEWATREGGVTEMRQDARLFSQYVRALGETGHLPELVTAVRDSLPLLHDATPATVASCRLFLFAFGGHRPALEKLFQGALKRVPKSTQLLWITTADLAAGFSEAAESLKLLTASDDPRVRRAAERRILVPPANASRDLSLELQNEILHQAGEAEVEEHLSMPSEKRRTVHPWVTYVLIGANVIYFLGEILNGGSTSEESLYKMGALVPEAVAQGDWWRLVAAMFLHAGPLHLGMNLFALRLVGPFVEMSVGGPQYLFCYLGSGLLSMGTVTFLSLNGILKEQFLVGASGAIMGLIGASGAIFFRVWRKERSPMASRRLTSIGMALLIQVAFDLSTREVSFTAHMAGVISGFLIGLMLRHNVGSREL